MVLNAKPMITRLKIDRLFFALKLFLIEMYSIQYGNDDDIHYVIAEIYRHKMVDKVYNLESIDPFPEK